MIAALQRQRLVRVAGVAGVQGTGLRAGERDAVETPARFTRRAIVVSLAAARRGGDAAAEPDGRTPGRMRGHTRPRRARVARAAPALTGAHAVHPEAQEMVAALQRQRQLGVAGVAGVQGAGLRAREHDAVGSPARLPARAVVPSRAAARRGGDVAAACRARARPDEKNAGATGHEPRFYTSRPGVSRQAARHSRSRARLHEGAPRDELASPPEDPWKIPDSSLRADTTLSDEQAFTRGNGP